MRIQLNRRSHDDHGAVAIIVAILAVVLFGLAAFSVDFGLAYTSKRNLQKGADAAALASASEIIKLARPTDTCAAIAARYTSDAAFRTALQKVADDYSRANRSSATRLGMEVRCSADSKRVEVLYRAGGTTPRLFGGLFGSGDYSTSRQAVADIFVPSSGQGLRPYFLCVSDLTRLQGTDGIVQVRYEKDSAPCGTFPGNWYTANCPVFQGNGDLADYTLNGCSHEVKIIEPVAPDTTVTQATVLSECSPSLQTKDPSGCLVSNPGNIASGSSQSGQQIIGAWDYLLTLPSIAVPIFNTQWKTWADAANTSDCKSNGQGANGCYPVQAIAGVKVCGYRWQNKDGLDPERAVPGSPCTGVDALLAAIPSSDKSNYLWLKLVGVQLTGSSKPAGCAVGSSCDGGSRGTRLVE
jgi:Putative Flp pilus-assembly TadE/G-like